MLELWRYPPSIISSLLERTDGGFRATLAGLTLFFDDLRGFLVEVGTGSGKFRSTTLGQYICEC